MEEGEGSEEKVKREKSRIHGKRRRKTSLEKYQSEARLTNYSKIKYVRVSAPWYHK